MLSVSSGHGPETGKTADDDLFRIFEHGLAGAAAGCPGIFETDDKLFSWP